MSVTTSLLEGARHSEAGIVGRGARESARLTREWFSSLTEAAREGRGAAYVFVMGNMNEVLRTFDLPIVFPEITALQTAVRGTSEEYLKESENYGYSPDICGYLKADVAMHLRGGEHPMGTSPKPLLAVTTNACNTISSGPRSGNGCTVPRWSPSTCRTSALLDVPAILATVISHSSVNTSSAR